MKPGNCELDVTKSNSIVLFIGRHKNTFCLYVWGFSAHSRIFQYGDVTITGEGLQISIYIRHSCPLSSGGSIACHTYCDTEHQFPRTRDTHTYCRAFDSGAVITCFNTCNLHVGI